MVSVAASVVSRAGRQSCAMRVAGEVRNLTQRPRAYRTRTLMCREKIHLFEKSQRFGFTQAGADRSGITTHALRPCRALQASISLRSWRTRGPWGSGQPLRTSRPLLPGHSLRPRRSGGPSGPGARSQPATSRRADEAINKARIDMCRHRAHTKLDRRQAIANHELVRKLPARPARVRRRGTIPIWVVPTPPWTTRTQMHRLK
jgi:hypothetical protein